MSQFEGVFTELEQYRREGGIVVCYDHAVNFECDQVIFDRTDNTYQGTKYLLEAGHREIGFFFTGAPAHNEPEFNSRHAGFDRALREYGVASRAEWYYVGTGDEEGGAALAKHILALKERPTAMVIVNETAAWAFIHHVNRAGIRVPHDMSIVSNDDLPIARYTTPPLTTVSQPVHQIATAAAELVKSRLRDHFDGPPRQIVVRGELVERESVAKPLPSNSMQSH
jgi:LacI family transcriptional regulator